MLPGDNPTVGVPFQIYASSQQSGFDRPTGSVMLEEGPTTVATGNFDSWCRHVRSDHRDCRAKYICRYLCGRFPNERIHQSAAYGQRGQRQPDRYVSSVTESLLRRSPFTVPASSSSELPVTLTVLSGPATFSGSLLTLTGVGTVTLQASQPGNANYLPAASVQQTFQVMGASLSINAVVNAAS